MLNNYKKNKGEKDYENETNQKITVINLLYDADKKVLDSKIENELTEDLISIIHHYSMKIYSPKRKKLQKIKDIIKEEE